VTYSVSFTEFYGIMQVIICLSDLIHRMQVTGRTVLAELPQFTSQQCTEMGYTSIPVTCHAMVTNTE
jgi:hypothetical protein